MCGLDVHDVSRRAFGFAERRRGSRRAVPLCIDSRREGHFDVRLHVVCMWKTSSGACERVCTVSVHHVPLCGTFSTMGFGLQRAARDPVLL